MGSKDVMIMRMTYSRDNKHPTAKHELFKKKNFITDLFFDNTS